MGGRLRKITWKWKGSIHIYICICVYIYNRYTYKCVWNEQVYIIALLCQGYWPSSWNFLQLYWRWIEFKCVSKQFLFSSFLLFCSQPWTDYTMRKNSPKKSSDRNLINFPFFSLVVENWYYNKTADGESWQKFSGSD